MCGQKEVLPENLFRHKAHKKLNLPSSKIVAEYQN